MLTRKQIIANIEAIDAEIDTLQASKRETYDDHRHNLVAVDGKEIAKAEIEGLKKAIQRRRLVSKHGVEAVEQKDDLVEEILAEISAVRAPRATRVEPIDEFDADSVETNPAPASSKSGQAERQPESTEQSAGANADERAPVSSAPNPEAKATEAEPDGAQGAPLDGVASRLSDGSGTVAPIQPETATERLDDLGSVQDGRKMSTDGHTSGSGSRPPQSEFAREVQGDPQQQCLTAGETAPNSLGSAADKSGEVGGVSPSTSPAPTKLKMNAEFFDEPHPACQRKEFCGGNSAIALCDACKAAAGIAHDGPTFQPEAAVH